MRVRADGFQLGDHLAGDGVGQEEVDAEKVALGEVGHEATVGRELGRDVDAAGVALFGEEPLGIQARQRVRVGEVARARRRLAFAQRLGAVGALLGDVLQLGVGTIWPRHRAPGDGWQQVRAQRRLPVARERVRVHSGDGHHG